MEKCPFCGSRREPDDQHIIEFECGTMGQDDKSLHRTATCQELCDLRKWRETVLSNVCISVPDYEPRHWTIDILGCTTDLPWYEHDDESRSIVREAFDTVVCQLSNIKWS